MAGPQLSEIVSLWKEGVKDGAKVDLGLFPCDFLSSLFDDGYIHLQVYSHSPPPQTLQSDFATSSSSSEVSV